jgi:hypothetical protein
MDPQPETSPAEQALRSVLGPVLKLDKELQAREDKLKEELREVHKERYRMSRIIKAIEEEPKPMGRQPGQKNKPKEKDHSTTYSISEERIALIGITVAQMEDNWTAGQVAEIVGLRAEQIRRALHHMRERGQVRQVGKDPNSPTGFCYTTTPKGQSELGGGVPVGANGARA